MENSGGPLRKPEQQKENRLVTLKGLGPEVSMVEPAPHKHREAASILRGRVFLILGIVLVCAVAGAWYFLERASVKAISVTASASAITADSVTITWTTEQPAASQVEYGTTPAYGTLSVFNAASVTSHSVTLTGLTPGTTYDYAALTTDAAGQVRTSPNFTFTTSGAAATAGAAGPVGAIGRVTADSVTANSATINWTTSQPLTSQVAYGATPSYGLLSVFNASLVTAHSVILTALTPGTTYNFAALSANSDGQISTSPNFTFTTTSVAGVPVVTKVTVSGVTVNSATISWTTDQPSMSQVEFGTTTAYGSLSAFGSTMVTSHSVTLNGLIPGTIYDAAALSSNSAGQVGRSADITFTTSAAPPAFSQVAVSGLTASSARITWITDQPSTSKVDYGPTTAYGSVSDANPSLTTSHSVALRRLTPGTAYNYSATSTNAAGMQNSSRNLSFTTPAR